MRVLRSNDGGDGLFEYELLGDSVQDQSLLIEGLDQALQPDAIHQTDGHWHAALRESA